jgi:hypothetical protein
MYTQDPSRKRVLPAVLLVLAPGIACSGSSEFTASHPPDGSADEDAGDNTNIVANPNRDAREAGTSPTVADATAGLTIVDASGPDAGVSDASGPDALVCPSMELVCDGGCLNNDLLNCGGCGKPCAMPANGAATCSASDAGFACGVSCNANFTHCGSSCVDLQSEAKNCGSCGHDCLGGTCASGSCQPWVVTQTSASSIFGWPNGVNIIRGLIASDGKYVAWVDATGVLEVPVLGGTAVNLAPSAQAGGGSFGSLVMASGHVAWNMTDSTNGFSVWTATEGVQSSGNVSASTGSGTTGGPLSDLALDPTGTSAYFIDDPVTNGSQAALYKCDMGGKTCSALQPVAASLTSAPNSVIVVGSQLYWTDSANGSIWRADDSPFGTPSAVITGQTYAPYFLVADSAYLYWAGMGSQGDFTLSRAPLANLNPTTAKVLLTATTGKMTVMAVDGTNLYFDGFSASTLDYVPIAGGAPARSLPAANPFALAVAGGAIYWLDDGDNKIYGLRFP